MLRKFRTILFNNKLVPTVIRMLSVIFRKLRISPSNVAKCFSTSIPKFSELELDLPEKIVASDSAIVGKLSGQIIFINFCAVFSCECD